MMIVLLLTVYRGIIDNEYLTVANQITSSAIVYYQCMILLVHVNSVSLGFLIYIINNYTLQKLNNDQI